VTEPSFAVVQVPPSRAPPAGTTRGSVSGSVRAAPAAFGRGGVTNGRRTRSQPGVRGDPPGRGRVWSGFAPAGGSTRPARAGAVRRGGGFGEVVQPRRRRRAPRRVVSVRSRMAVHSRHGWPSGSTMGADR